MKNSMKTVTPLILFAAWLSLKAHAQYFEFVNDDVPTRLDMLGGPLAGPTAATVVRQRYSGPSNDRAADVVTILTFEAALSGVTSDGWPWVELLAAFAAIYVAFGVLAFGSLLEET